MKEHITKMQFVIQHGPCSFLDFVSCHLQDAQKKRAQGPSFRIFWEAKMGPGAHLRTRGRPVSGREVLSVSVEGAMEWRMTDFERHNHRFLVDCGKPSLVAIFSLLMPAVAIFSMAKSSCADTTILVAKNACKH